MKALAFVVALAATPVAAETNSQPYSPSTYSVGERVTVGHSVYQAEVGGTSGANSAPPTTRPTSAQDANAHFIDGSVTWQWINDAGISSSPPPAVKGGDGWTLTNSLGQPDLPIVGTWVLYTQTYGGRIGIEHGLTKDECEVKRKQVLGEPATDEEKAAAKMFADEAQAKGPKIQAVSGLAFPASMRTTSDILHAECRDKPLESKR